jgi:biopolymer transport protein ExbD
MRAYRKRPWASLMVNMTPLIDVVFLIIIFFIIMINFSEILIRKVTLPKADEAKEIKEHVIKKITITIKSEKFIFVDRKKVSLYSLEETLRQKVRDPRKTTALLRGDENSPYDAIQKVMEKVAFAGITRIEFSTYKEAVPPLERDINDEASDQSNR